LSRDPLHFIIVLKDINDILNAHFLKIVDII
jgi:hypothetical protein